MLLKNLPLRGWAALLAERLGFSDWYEKFNGYAVKAEPQEIGVSDGKPEAFRKDSAKGALILAEVFGVAEGTKNVYKEA